MLAVATMNSAHSGRFIPCARARGAIRNSATVSENSRSHHTCTPHRLLVWLISTGNNPSAQMVTPE